ncbi:uncharacterized protein LOC110066092 [Orbicella faveolata]|uniref:uncharacterized protein LOC110066092 n=1 Tax=Orbicella faveolata TaxID=48498 RepID=UPI0009E5241E|nr:uncharacterized protein LOC110066092 [Orbicella faveolata]
MMANISLLERRTRYSLLLLVVSGLSILPFASCQYCNTVVGEPQINISSTPPFNKLSMGAAINLTCTAWQTDQLAKHPWTRPHRIEWFDPQDKRIGFQCRAGWPPARLMKCTLEVGVLTDGKLGSYTCRARNGYDYCSTKKFQIGPQDIPRPEVVK